MHSDILSILCCPITGQQLTFHAGDESYLLTTDGNYRYPVVNGIAMLLAEDAQPQEGKDNG